EYRDAKRSHQVAVLDKHLRMVRLPIPVRIFKNDHAVSLTMVQGSSRVVIEIPIIHSFCHPNPTTCIDINVCWIIKHRRLSPESSFQVIRQEEFRDFVFCGIRPTGTKRQNKCNDEEISRAMKTDHVRV